MSHVCAYAALFRHDFIDRSSGHHKQKRKQVLLFPLRLRVFLYPSEFRDEPVKSRAAEQYPLRRVCGSVLLHPYIDSRALGYLKTG